MGQNFTILLYNNRAYPSTVPCGKAYFRESACAISNKKEAETDFFFERIFMGNYFASVKVADAIASPTILS